MQSKGVLHHDVKPANFPIGLDKTQMNLHIIDFGISKRYPDPNTGQHMGYRDRKSMIGSATYVSINCLRGIKSNRGDDLEALGYCLDYFLKGELSWQGIVASNKKEKYQKILEKKLKTPIEILFKVFPDEIGDDITYCRNLGFDECSDYESLKR